MRTEEGQLVRVTRPNYVSYARVVLNQGIMVLARRYIARGNGQVLADAHYSRFAVSALSNPHDVPDNILIAHTAWVLSREKP